MNAKITKALEENGFEADTRYNNGWMSSITYKKYPHEHLFCIHFDSDYEFVDRLIHKIDDIDLDMEVRYIIQYISYKDFSVDRMVAVRNVLKFNLFNLKQSLDEIKSWMDGNGKREICYEISFKIYVNNQECNMLDLKESERDRILKDVYRILDSKGVVYNIHNKFVSAEYKHKTKI